MKEWFERFYWRIWRNKIRYWHYSLYYGVRNLIRWFPVIWADRDWDHVYMVTILEKKIRSMAHSANAYWTWVGADEAANDLERIANKLAFHLHHCEDGCDLCPGCNTKEPLASKALADALREIADKCEAWWD